MAFQNTPGGPLIPIGPNINLTATTAGTTSIALDAANEAVIFYGQVFTEDGGSHTIDTTGSSSLQWRTGTVTFASGSTTVKVGLAAMDTGTGPPGRAANAADVITFDVNASFTGGGGGITGAAWQTSVPTTGTKTIANGDFVAFAIQMTARGGTDSILVTTNDSDSSIHRVGVTSFLAAAYTGVTAIPNCVISFSDGVLGYFLGGNVLSSITTRTWNTGGAVDEYGQLFNFPFPMKIYGIYGWGDFDNDLNVILYSDPLGTPVAEKTVALDGNTMAASTGRRFRIMFPAPYTYKPNTDIVLAYSPGASNVSVYYKTIANAAHRTGDVWGTNGYGVQRAVTGVGAFSNANSSLDHYYIGILASAFEHGVWPGGHLGV